MAHDLETGETLFNEGNIQAAEICFRELIKRDPNNIDALNNLGVIRHRQNDPAGAEDFFRKALTVKNGYLPVLVNLASLLESTGRWPEAAVCLEDCISSAPEDAELYNRAARVYLTLGTPEKAGPMLEKTLRLHPEQSNVKKTLDYLIREGQYQPDKTNTASDVSRQDHLMGSHKADIGAVKNGKPWWTVKTGDRLPEVSVGLLVYNGGELLSQAMRSSSSCPGHTSSAFFDTDITSH